MYWKKWKFKLSGTDYIYRLPKQIQYKNRWINTDDVGRSWYGIFYTCAWSFEFYFGKLHGNKQRIGIYLEKKIIHIDQHLRLNFVFSKLHVNLDDSSGFARQNKNVPKIKYEKKNWKKIEFSSGLTLIVMYTLWYGRCANSRFGGWLEYVPIFGHHQHRNEVDNGQR